MGGEYTDKFNDLYNKMHDPNNGFFSKQGVPYHCKETLIVEGPLYGHDSASETLSYYIWNEALYGKFTGDWDPLVDAWQVMEKYYIPGDDQQANMKDYNPKKPASYAPECDDPQKFPVSMDINASQSSDPIHTELVAKYGSKIYDMHWLVDVDNWIGFGDGDTPTHYDSYARGPHESCWKAIPHPCEESFKYGASNGGFLPLYTQDTNYSKQNKWTNAPDASGRLTAAIYMAQQWSGGNNDKVNGLVTKCSQLMDWLRYCTFDKYFKPIGAQDKSATCNDLSSCHYLIGWYYAFGCPQVSNGWAFKIGCSHNHMGYQSPMAAWIASTQQPFTQNMTQSGPGHWGKSMNRQLQFYKWLQSEEGLFAGGATNCFNGQYDKYPADLTTFFNMVYVAHPAYLEPPSNGWFGFQCWSGVRVMQYLYYSKDSTYEPMMAKWAKYVTDNIKDDPSIGLTIPASIEWTGCPDSNFSDDSGIPADNNNLHVKITQYGQDTGIMAALATCLMYFAAYKNDYKQYKDVAKKLLDFILDKGKTDVGYSFTEQRADYSQFNQEVYIPSSYQGAMPNGEQIQSGATFLGLRNKYKDDPMWPQVADCLQNNKTFECKYHRFWGQSEVLVALGTYDILFNPQPTPEAPQTSVSSPPPRPPTPTSAPARNIEDVPTSVSAPKTGNTGSVPSSNCTCNPCKCNGCDKDSTTPPGGVKTTPANSNMDLNKSEFELKVIGSKITLKDQEFVLKGINWFGFETAGQCVEGLTTHTLEWYLDLLSTNKFNAIRLPYAWDLAKDMDKITPSEKLIDYKINPDFKGLTSGQIMDLLIKKAGDRGILVMLDMHRINGANNTIPELWYSEDAPEADIISVWKAMATRYKDQWNIFAYDLKNEGHTSIEVGTGSNKDLWAYFGRVGNELLKINPKALIVCEGYDKYVNPQKQIWAYNGWGSSIQVMQDGHKVDLSNPSKLLYSTHNYPKSVSGTEGNMTEDKLRDNFGFAVEKGIAAVVPGEWSCKSDGPDADWMAFYVKYLKKIGSTSNFFWTLNPSSGDTGGYLKDDWTTVDPLKQKVLEDLNPNPPKISVNGDSLQVQNLGAKITKAVVQEGVQSSGDAAVTPPPTNGPTVEQKKTNEWTSGADTIQQFDVVITNTTSATLQSLVLQVSNQSSIKQLWNMQQGDSNTYTLPTWKTLQAKDSHTFGFQSLKTPLAEFSLKSFQ